MPKEDNKILKYNHGEKSIKVPFIFYVFTYFFTYFFSVYLIKEILFIIILKSHQELK